MTPDDLAEKLREVKPGEGARVTYEIYEMIWPPGEPDQRSRAAAYDFAKAHDCKIENRPDDGAVWFYKDA